MNDETARELHPHAHPMPGWLCVFVIPSTEEEAEEVKAKVAGIPGLFAMLELGPPERGVTAAIVIEVGLLGTDLESHFSTLGFGKGSKVYYREDRGIDIGEYQYVAMNSMIAWNGEHE